MILTILMIILQTEGENDTVASGGEVSIPGIEIWFWVGIVLIIFLLVLIFKHMLITGRMIRGKKV